jgi:hypothetical protein
MGIQSFCNIRVWKPQNAKIRANVVVRARINSADCWETLGISRNSSVEEAKAAYRKLIKEVHPDLNPDNVDGANRSTIDLNNAYFQVIQELSEGESQSDLDIFDVCDEEPSVLFVNPLLCYGVPPVHWYKLQVKLSECQNEVDFCSELLKLEGIRVPDEAFVYLTRSQHNTVMNKLEELQDEFDFVGIEASQYYLADALSRAQWTNLRTKM